MALYALLAWVTGQPFQTGILGAALLIAPLNAGLVAAQVYRWPNPGKGRRLCYLQTPQARAVLALKPDRRRRALPGDEYGTYFSAWPRGTGTGARLGAHAIENVHARGGRLTLSAFPQLADRYRRHGLIVDGTTAVWPLVRMASRSDETQ